LRKPCFLLAEHTERRLCGSCVLSESNMDGIHMLLHIDILDASGNESVRLTIRAEQVCELGAFSTPNQVSSVSKCLRVGTLHGPTCLVVRMCARAALLGGLPAPLLGGAAAPDAYHEAFMLL